ncbi:MAG: cysteine desulfurase-like protein [Planctomycetota bacterium]|jgi:cysteine desulfurase family protein (TIGR01976 family)
MTTTGTARSDVGLDAIRARFPALAGETIYLENAGGSQVPRVVADAIHRYLLESYVQLEADYEMSRRCTETVEGAHEFVNLFMNGTGRGRVILGPSCSQLCTMLAGCYAEALEPGDELIVAETGHEANVGPWVRLADRGLTVRVWPLNRDEQACRIEDLAPLLGPRTRVVAFPHVSNLLGGIVDVPAVTDLVHEAGARVVVDGVAYAPHRAIDVASWDVDWYVYSTYKVYGPHMAALYGRDDALAELTGPNHFFIPKDEVPYKFELGGASHEGCAGLLALGSYLAFLAGGDESAAADRAVIERAFEAMARRERPLQERLVTYLQQRRDVRIIGPADASEGRVATISFVHESKSSREIASAVNARNIGIRHGHMYAHRLCTALGLDPEDGVVRVSALHYNTPAEIDRLVGVLDEVL